MTHEFESPAWIELGALTEDGKTLRVRSFYSGDSNVILSCLKCSTQYVWLLNARRLERHWQTHLLMGDATADNTSLLIQVHVQYQRGTVLRRT